MMYVRAKYRRMGTSTGTGGYRADGLQEQAR